MRLAIISCVSNSKADPKAISRKCINSLSDFREEPSAIFDGIDIAARCIWLDIPNLSSSGNCAVSLYMSVTKSVAMSQIEYFLKSLIHNGS